MLIHVPSMAAAALGLKIPPLVEVEDSHCAFCAADLNGQGVPLVFGEKFVDFASMANRMGKATCGPCKALRHRTALTGASASGFISEGKFSRLLSTDERLLFLLDPPSKPFAVAIVNAQQQHVWWHTPASYDRNYFVIRYGSRTLDVDRLAAIEIAEKVRAFEEANKKYSRALYSFTKNLKAQHDGHLKGAFSKDDSLEAVALKQSLIPLSLGTRWAAQQLMSALRNHKTLSLTEAASKAELNRKYA